MATVGPVRAIRRVGRSGDDLQAEQPLYNKAIKYNSRLDADKDGVACEKA